MQCPACGSDDIRAGEFLELFYDVDDDGEPGELVNGEDLLEGPGDTYLVCMECYHRWERDGAPFDPSALARRVP